MQDKTITRTRDFWASLTLMALSVFFLWKTSAIPFLAGNSNVQIGDWYNSAALVPYGLFGALFLLSFLLLLTSIREGGAKQALSLQGLGWDKQEVWRSVSLAIILLCYFFALVPRVDFILASALVILSLVFGYHRGNGRRMLIAVSLVLVASLYAVIMRFPQSEWNTHHDDDLVVLAVWCVFVAMLAFVSLGLGSNKGRVPGVLIPAVLSLLTPAFLVMSMAFGFRQNVPNRGGLLFSKIEFVYYVHVLPVLRK